MAFNPNNFKALTRKKGRGGRRIWHYVTTDAIATVTGSGYFNKVASSLTQYDIIQVVDSNVPTYDTIFVTSASHAATVTTVNAT